MNRNEFDKIVYGAKIKGKGELLQYEDKEYNIITVIKRKMSRGASSDYKPILTVFVKAESKKGKVGYKKATGKNAKNILQTIKERLAEKQFKRIK